jgi:hypothetical protein
MPRSPSPTRPNPNDWLELLLQPRGPPFVQKYKTRVVQLVDVPPFLLGAFWRAIVLPPSVSISETEYKALLLNEDFKFQSEIARDINRTFPNLKFFTELRSLGQSQLFNVLKAYSIHNPEVGYCQGMGFLVGMLLSHMDELDAFNVLSELMRKDGEYNMQGLYKPGLPLLNDYLGKLDKMISTEIPRLSDHFTSLGVETSMFASQWILTLFVYNLEWSQAKNMFNLFLLFKMEIVLKFALYILQRCEKDLISMGFEEVLGKVNNMTGVKVADFMDWLQKREANNVRIDQDIASSDDSNDSS